MRKSRVLRAAVITVLAGMITALAACGGDSKSSGGDQPTIGMVSLAGSDYFAGYERGAKQEAQKLGIKLDIQKSPGLEVSDFTSTVNATVAKRPDYLLAPAVDSTALRAPLLAATKRGVKVITYDTQVDDPSFVETFVNADYYEYGRKAGLALGEQVGGKGEVLLLSIVTGQEDLEKLAAGFSDGLPPRVTELPVQYTQGENAKASAIIRATLTRHPDLAGIAAASSFGGEGAITALRGAHKTRQVKAVLLSASKFAVDALRKGDVQVVVSEALADIGAAAVRAAYDESRGAKLPERILVPLCTIDAKTIDDPKNAPCIQ